MKLKLVWLLMLFGWIGWIGLSAPANLLAGGGPENVVLVVNADSASSKLIANHYIYARKIPARNVIYLNGIPNREVMQLKDFKDKILNPILKEIESRKILATTDYIVYSADFPTAIGNRPHLDKLVEIAKKQTGQEPQKKLFNPTAAITSLTYFAGSMLVDDPGYMLLSSNTYYRRPARTLLKAPFRGEAQIEFQKATKNIELNLGDRSIKQAIETLKKLAKKNPQQIAIPYWLARAYGKLDDAARATNWINRAIQLGWCYRDETLSDASFDSIKDDPVFSGTVARIPDQAFDFAPTHGFRSGYLWAPNSGANRELGQGNRYFLSTVLAVTRNHGNTEKDALISLQRSIKSDATNPQGTFYFTTTSDVRTRTRKPNFPVAIKALEKMGHNTKIVAGRIPENADDVIGLTCGTPGFNWITTGSKIQPGAFCDNLTSFGGRLAVAGQTKLNEFIANGAAGASGTVTEPYALQQKFPHPMIHVHYARGCSLAESFFQSVHGPFQTLVVGDALCQPWAKKPVVTVDGVQPGDTVTGKVKLKLDDSQSPAQISRIQIFVDGLIVAQSPMTNSISIDTRDLSDGYHEIRIVTIDDTPIESKGHVVLPVLVDNQGYSTQLSTDKSKFRDSEDIKIQATSNHGNVIRIVHNGREIAEQTGRNTVFSIPGKLVGRGPVKLTAVAISKDGQKVSSLPILLNVEGKIATRKQNTEPVARKKQKPKKPKQPRTTPNPAPQRSGSGVR